MSYTPFKMSGPSLYSSPAKNEEKEEKNEWGETPEQYKQRMIDMGLRKPDKEEVKAPGKYLGGAGIGAAHTAASMAQKNTVKPVSEPIMFKSPAKNYKEGIGSYASMKKLNKKARK